MNSPSPEEPISSLDCTICSSSAKTFGNAEIAVGAKEALVSVRKSVKTVSSGAQVFSSSCYSSHRKLHRSKYCDLIWLPLANCNEQGDEREITSLIQAASAFATASSHCVNLCSGLSWLRALGKLPGHTLDVTGSLWLRIAFLLSGKSRFWNGSLQKAL